MGLCHSPASALLGPVPPLGKSGFENPAQCQLPPSFSAVLCVSRGQELSLFPVSLYVTHCNARPNAWHIEGLNKYIFNEQLNK